MEVLPKSQPIPRENLNGLQTLLQEAESGNIQSYCIAAINRDGDICTAHYVGEKAHKLVGVLEYLKVRIFDYWESI